jgi:hypothetical protein
VRTDFPPWAPLGSGPALCQYDSPHGTQARVVLGGGLTEGRGGVERVERVQRPVDANASDASRPPSLRARLPVRPTSPTPPGSWTTLTPSAIHHASLLAHHPRLLSHRPSAINSPSPHTPAQSRVRGHPLAPGAVVHSIGATHAHIDARWSVRFKIVAGFGLDCLRSASNPPRSITSYSTLFLKVTSPSPKAPSLPPPAPHPRLPRFCNRQSSHHPTPPLLLYLTPPFLLLSHQLHLLYLASFVLVH